MRILLEVFVAAVLIALAWDKSYRERLSQTPVVGTRFAATPPPAASHKSPSPGKLSNGEWMWNRQTVLDRPAYNKDHTFTGHVFYVDDQGNRYWLDAQGQRHYDR